MVHSPCLRFPEKLVDHPIDSLGESPNLLGGDNRTVFVDSKRFDFNKPAIKLAAFESLPFLTR